MFERFTDRARRAIVLAQEESRILNHNYIGTEHLLLGLIHEGEGAAGRALKAVGVNLERVREEVLAVIGRGTDRPSGHIPFTPRAKKVLEFTLREATRLGANYLDTEHILLGLLREGDGVGVQVLSRLGIDLKQLRGAVESEIRATAVSPGEIFASEEGPPVEFTETLQTSAVEGSRSPRCVRCRADLLEFARCRTLDVPNDTGEGTTKTMTIYCGSCGEVMAVKVFES
jgi:ATP-dependent Clp protease ATP-binding subunit ClpC